MRTIHGIFSKYPEVKQVQVFGSRAKGNYKNGSDIDLAVMNSEITFKTISHLRSDFQESSIPYSVDIVNFAMLKHEDFIDHIKRVGQIFYEKKAQVSILTR